MTGPKAYVIGAGLAGLSAATALAEKHVEVQVLEAAPQAGGRCRSYFDSQMNQVIDNGNHLVLSGNHATYGYLHRLGAEQGLIGPEKAAVDWIDLRSGERWIIAPNSGPLPRWIFDKARRVPGTRTTDYAELGKLVWLRHDRRLCDVLSCKGTLWDRLLDPFFLAALNTDPKSGSARLAGALVRETFAKGGAAYRLRVAHPTLSSVFVTPAISYLESRGGAVGFGQRLRKIVFDRRSAIALEMSDRTLPLSAGDRVVLAVPPWVAAELVPDLRVPDEFSAIVNAHFRFPAPDGAPLILGVLGGTAQWIFSFADRLSVTVSAADAIVNDDRETLAARLWDDVCRAFKLSATLPPWQIVKEKRATFAATPEQAARRPEARTVWSNLFLAGDWTATGLPATIEGAIRSGHAAARLAVGVGR